MILDWNLVNFNLGFQGKTSNTIRNDRNVMESWREYHHGIESELEMVSRISISYCRDDAGLGFAFDYWGILVLKG